MRSDFLSKYVFLRRFSNPNKINAFIGIDPGRYQSGEMDSN
ncbi:transposase, partial [Lactobacillus crispatus]